MIKQFLKLFKNKILSIWHVVVEIRSHDEMLFRNTAAYLWKYIFSNLSVFLTVRVCISEKWHSFLRPCHSSNDL